MCGWMMRAADGGVSAKKTITLAGDDLSTKT